LKKADAGVDRINFFGQSATYMAEVVRGWPAAIPKGQILRAASALGLAIGRQNGLVGITAALDHW